MGIVVRILNGNGVSGVVCKLREYLLTQGFDVSETTNADHFNYEKTINSDTHVKGMVDYIEDELSHYKVKVWHKEGYINLEWILMDYVDVVVHLFDAKTREYYDLETLWADAEKIVVRDE